MTTLPAIIGAEFTPLGLALPDDMSFEDWKRMGRPLMQMAQSSMWWLGDWLRHGERKWGDMYTDAVAETGLAPGTLRNAVYVAGRFDVSRRRDNLSWNHHYEVAAFDPDEQDEILAEAEEHAWSRDDLRNEIRRRRAVPASTREPSPLVGVSVVVVGPVDSKDEMVRYAERAGDGLRLALADVVPGATVKVRS